MWAARTRLFTQRKIGFGLKVLTIGTVFLVIAGLVLKNQDYCISKLAWNGTKLVAFEECADIAYKEVTSSEVPKTIHTPAQPSRFKIVLSRQPYNGDPDCEDFVINLYRPKTFELTALVSYPGSGNTWLRHLIEFSTGIFTGSVYFDEELYGKGFYGEKEAWFAGSTIAQKLHDKYSIQYAFPKGILLLREPYEAIVSFVQFLEAGHLGSASPSTFKHSKWQEYLMGETYSWITLAKSWIESPARLLVVHYEHLKKNLTQELQRICEFVNVPCRNINHTCFMKHMDGHFHRKKQLKPFLKFDGWVQERIDDGIAYLSQLLVKRGHQPLPINLYKYYRRAEAKLSS